jgi:uncharacterized repeat protein (TIGR04052 family)
MIKPNILSIRPQNKHKRFKYSLLLLFIFLSTSCTDATDKSKLSEINVQVLYKQEALKCGQALAIGESDWDIERLAFFVSGLNTSQNGVEQALTLHDNDWQNDGVALLALTDCSAEQTNSEDPTSPLAGAYHATLQLAQPQHFAEDSHLRFTLGIPFELNHLNPLSQKSPLNIPSMFWSWRAGHKFFRIDMQGQQQSWVFHLGSIGCVADSAMRSPSMQCKEPNRIEFDLQKQQQGQVLVLHLDRLLAGLELNFQSACLMQPEQPSCQVLMTNLGDNQVFEWR